MRGVDCNSAGGAPLGSLGSFTSFVCVRLLQGLEGLQLTVYTCNLPWEIALQ